MAAALPPGTVHAGHRCSGFEQDDDAARVKFANGTSAEADIVIAADGIHSELRPRVFPPSRPVFHGSVAYRGLVPHERLPEIYNLADALVQLERGSEAIPYLEERLALTSFKRGIVEQTLAEAEAQAADDE